MSINSSTNFIRAAEIEGVYIGAKLRYTGSKHYEPIALFKDIVINGQYAYPYGWCVYTRPLAQLGQLQRNTLVASVNACYLPPHSNAVELKLSDITLGVGVGLFPIKESQIATYLYTSRPEIREMIQHKRLPKIKHKRKIEFHVLTLDKLKLLSKCFMYKLYIAKLNWFKKQGSLWDDYCPKIIKNRLYQKPWGMIWKILFNTYDFDYDSGFRFHKYAKWHINYAIQRNYEILHSQTPQSIQLAVKYLHIPNGEPSSVLNQKITDSRHALHHQLKHDLQAHRIKEKEYVRRHLLIEEHDTKELRHRLAGRRYERMQALQLRYRTRLRAVENQQRKLRQKKILLKKLRMNFRTLFYNHELMILYRQLENKLADSNQQSGRFFQLRRYICRNITLFAKRIVDVYSCKTGRAVQDLSIEQASYMTSLLDACNELQISFSISKELKNICFKIIYLSAGINKAMNQALVHCPLVHNTDEHSHITRHLGRLSKSLCGHYSKYDVWFSHRESQFIKMINGMSTSQLALQHRQLAMNQRRGLLQGYKSYGEQQMKSILDYHRISYKHGYHLENRLHLDFYLPEQSLGIEIDGEPHFHGVSYQDNYSLKVIHQRFDAQLKRDQLKDKYCKQHHITLIRIQYIDENFFYIEWVQEHMLKKLSRLPKGRVIHIGNLYGFENIA